MELNGIILSSDDIELKTRVNRQTGEETQTGKFRFLVSHPSDLIDVSLSADQVKDGVAKALSALVGKQTKLHIAYRDMGFAGENGQHVSIKGFTLHQIPEVK